VNPPLPWLNLVVMEIRNKKGLLIRNVQTAQFSVE